MTDRSLKRAVFADLELTCWNGPPPAGEKPEIIQIGIAEIDLATLEPRRTFMRHVRPRVSRISPFCQALTGITPAEARAGRPLEEVARSVRREFGQTPWIAWGDDDAALRAAAAEQGCETPLPGPQFNLSLLFHQLIGSERKLGLEEAMALLGLAFEGRPHDALTDAINTGRLFSALSRLLRNNLRVAESARSMV